ncbi:MAG: Clp1/GlmU family protein, partial [Nitrososphaerales archaeon]
MLKRFINLTPESILLVKGPARVRCEGNVTVLGTNIDDEVIIRAGKVLPFEANGPSKINVGISRGGSYRMVKDGDRIGVSIWKDVADKMRHGSKRVMLVGATDTGKSTLTTFLSNTAHANGLKVGVIDGDVGQGDLAPPSCIGAALIRKQFLDLRDIDAEYYAFIGSISPMGIEKLVIDSMKQILDKMVARSDICMINTDGYVDEYGINYKIALAEALKPDLIVYIGEHARKFNGFEVVHVNAPTGITKTRAEREGRRLAQYARFVGNGEGERSVYAAKKNFAFMGKVYDQSIFQGDLIKIQNFMLPSDVMKGMFVGLAIGDDVKGFGVVTKMASGKIIVKTAYEGKFDTIMLSTIRLARNMRREYQISLVTNVDEGSEGPA